MVLNSEELSVNIKHTYISKTISDVLGEVSIICNVSDKLEKLDDIIQRLEGEIIKMDDAFKSQLPLTVALVNDAIVALKEEVIECTKPNVEPELEEFIPLNKSCHQVENYDVKMQNESIDKKNWMSSVQLSNYSDNQIPEFNSKQNKLVEINTEFVQENVAMTGDLPVAAIKEDMEESHIAELSLFIPGPSSPSEGLGSSVGSSKTSSSRADSSSPTAQSELGTSLEPLQQQARRKQRRYWSPDLHRRFVSALQQLGGPHVATPRQIREHMQVDGLTNDQVKSHLQKYRLYTHKAPAGTTSTPAKRHARPLEALWTCQDQCSESAKLSRTQSIFPHSSLRFIETREGDKFEGYCCKTPIHTFLKPDV